MAEVIVAKHITKRFYYPTAIEIFRDINFSLSAGKSAAIIGKSGEGKTTLLHILGTIDEPTSGTITINGKVANSRIASSIRNQEIGFVFQAFHLIADTTALENVLLPVKIARQNSAKNSPAFERAEHLLEMVGLRDRMHFPVDKLSGGERQRVAIARAFINNPSILLADEPTGNLDHSTAMEIQELLLSVVKNENKALLVVTHNPTFASLLDDVYELEGGLLSRK